MLHAIGYGILGGIAIVLAVLLTAKAIGGRLNEGSQIVYFLLGFLAVFLINL